MARILVWVPDLLFGSRVVSAVREAGHEPELVPQLPDRPQADAAIIDLTAEATERIAAAGALVGAGIPTLAFYSHVEADVPAAASSAGITRAVPRSRMAREGRMLIDQLLAS